jgi:hypothetical protein
MSSVLDRFRLDDKVAIIHEPRTAGRVLYLGSGDRTIRHALEQTLGGTGQASV